MRDLSPSVCVHSSRKERVSMENMSINRGQKPENRVMVFFSKQDKALLSESGGKYSGWKSQ